MLRSMLSRLTNVGDSCCTATGGVKTGARKGVESSPQMPPLHDQIGQNITFSGSRQPQIYECRLSMMNPEEWRCPHCCGKRRGNGCGLRTIV